MFDTFKCDIGVRQGENLSSLFFALLLNDFDHAKSEHYQGLDLFNTKNKYDFDIDQYFKLFSLLYADDTIVMAESESELQFALDAVYAYCEEKYRNK